MLSAVFRQARQARAKPRLAAPLPPAPVATPTGPRRVFIYAMNYAPELIGVGKYTGEIGAYLADSGTEVEVVTTAPHYPEWRAKAPYRADRYSVERRRRLRITRCPLVLTANMRGLARVLAPLSFALSSAPIALWRILRFRPDTVLCIEPTLAAAPVALLAAKLIGARTVLHVQDLELDAAFAVGHLKGASLRRAAHHIDAWLHRAFDHVVTISSKMSGKLRAKSVAADRLSLVRNWVRLDKIYPMLGANRFRRELALPDEAFIALYAGSLGAKQALHVVMDAARALQERRDIVFVIAGDGPERARLVAHALPNVRFLPLQPEDRFCELLNLASVHLLPQDRGAEDLVLPSKLGGMLASGRPIIAQAEHGSELHDYLARNHSVVAPGCAHALSSAILAHVSRRASLHAVATSCADLDATHNLSLLRRILQRHDDQAPTVLPQGARADT